MADYHGTRRGVMVGGAVFDTKAFEKAVVDAVTIGINQSLTKAFDSAVADAPVRAVFKKGSWRRTRGGRARGFTLDEANSEDAIRRRLFYRNADGQVVPLRSAEAGLNRTSGRPAPASANNPYLRRAATRKGNPNSFAPLLLEKGTTRADIKEFQQIQQELREKGYGRGQQLEMEVKKPVYGGRELTRTGKMASRKAKSNLDARGKYDLRTGRANFTDPLTGVTTIGGTLRKSIRKIEAVRYMNSIRGSVVSPVRYSKFQEFGTRHNRATPYMRPAMLKLTTSYRQEIVKAINRISFRAARRR